LRRQSRALHVVEISVYGRLALVDSRSVKVGHSGFYLIFAVHGSRRLLIVIIVDAAQAFMLVAMMIPWLLRLSEVILVG